MKVKKAISKSETAESLNEKKLKLISQITNIDDESVLDDLLKIQDSVKSKSTKKKKRVTT